MLFRSTTSHESAVIDRLRKIVRFHKAPKEPKEVQESLTCPNTPILKPGSDRRKSTSLVDVRESPSNKRVVIRERFVHPEDSRYSIELNLRPEESYALARIRAIDTLNKRMVDDVMKNAIKTHHHDELKFQGMLSNVAGALPALGIVACVLGVVKTMGAIDQPPPVLGALIGAALVGTMMGVFLSYAMFEPFAGRLAQVLEEESQVYNVIMKMIVSNLKGEAQPVTIEAARACISHHNQPSFSEVFDALRGA